jgi:transposase-like protein
VVRIFPNREACLRLVTALAVEQSEEWIMAGATSTCENQQSSGRKSGSRRK